LGASGTISGCGSLVAYDNPLNLLAGRHPIVTTIPKQENLLDNGDGIYTPIQCTKNYYYIGDEMSCEITKDVIKILRDNTEDSSDVHVDENTELEALGIDSFELLESIFDLEDKFDIAIPNPGETEGMDTDFETVGDVVEAVKKLMSKSPELV
jgi:acyl carrier protein